MAQESNGVVRVTVRLRRAEVDALDALVTHLNAERRPLPYASHRRWRWNRGEVLREGLRALHRGDAHV